MSPSPTSSRRSYSRPENTPDTEPYSRSASQRFTQRMAPVQLLPAAPTTIEAAEDSDFGERPTLPCPPPLSLPPSSRRTFTLQEAAAKLKMDPDALRMRCTRAMRRVGPNGVGELGGGFRCFKFGSSWRIRFPSDW